MFVFASVMSMMMTMTVTVVIAAVIVIVAATVIVTIVVVIIIICGWRLVMGIGGARLDGLTNFAFAARLLGRRWHGLCWYRSRC